MKTLEQIKHDVEAMMIAAPERNEITEVDVKVRHYPNAKIKVAAGLVHLTQTDEMKKEYTYLLTRREALEIAAALVFFAQRVM